MNRITTARFISMTLLVSLGATLTGPTMAQEIQLTEEDKARGE